MMPAATLPMDPSWWRPRAAVSNTAGTDGGLADGENEPH